MRHSVVIFSPDEKLSSVLAGYCKRILGGELSVCCDFISARAAIRPVAGRCLDIVTMAVTFIDECCKTYGIEKKS